MYGIDREAVAFETSGLDEIIPLTDQTGLSGQFTIVGNDVEGRIWDMTVTDHETGKVAQIPAFEVNLSNEEHVLADIESGHYTVEFSFRRSAGRKGLKIFFGKTANSMVQWEFGGWDNWDCNIMSMVNGRGSTISHRIFHVEDVEYRLKLEVTGRRIQTWVNGVLWNDTVDRLPELEELYITASVGRPVGRTDAEAGAEKDIVYLKVVNLTGEEKAVTLLLDGEPKERVRITSFTADSLAAENTFENPDRVAPTESEKMIAGNQMAYTFPAHSVTVLAYEE